MTLLTVVSGVSNHPVRSMPLAHVPDFYNRYPGEEVYFYTRLTAEKDLAGAVLSVALPPGLQLVEYVSSHREPALTAFMRDLSAGQIVDWHLGKNIDTQQSIEVITRARVLGFGAEVYLVSVADLRNAQGELLSSESARVAVRPAGAYMSHLPEIYHGNPFLGRFMMLFESFWKPISQQIDQVEVYFDPDLTPTRFLPWLASWLGVTWDENLPEERLRNLLRAAISLYQRRGTRSAMEDYLKIYTAGEVEIVEHRAQNFVLGANTLGPAVALGRQNMPHTFSVNITVDAQEMERMNARDTSRNESAYRQKLESVIETRKPAHTAFRLNLNVDKAHNKIGRQAAGQERNRDEQ